MSKKETSIGSALAEAIEHKMQGAPPRITDPGGNGWAQEPKVTDAERMLYGEHAGIVRLLGQAAVAAENAYSLACKHSAEPAFVATDDDDEFLWGLVGSTWAVYDCAVSAHREAAEKAIARRRRFGTPGGEG